MALRMPTLQQTENQALNRVISHVLRHRPVVDELQRHIKYNQSGKHVGLLGIRYEVSI